jgi:glycosyltransferase involved in cell wall biosynthesis
MHCGLPVITSSSSSLPELAGDAALTVDPLNVDGIAQHMTQISGNAELRGLLREKGYTQAARFTWAKAAEEVMSVLEAAAGSAAGR